MQYAFVLAALNCQRDPRLKQSSGKKITAIIPRRPRISLFFLNLLFLPNEKNKQRKHLTKKKIAY
jgi:hypothetical protein